MSQRLRATNLHLRGEARQSSNAGLTPQQKAALTRAANRQQEKEADQAIALAASTRRESIMLPYPFVIYGLSVLLAPRHAMTKAKNLAIWRNTATGSRRGGASSSKRTLSQSTSPAPIAKRTKHGELCCL
jgi:hypothetical protein